MLKAILSWECMLVDFRCCWKACFCNIPSQFIFCSLIKDVHSCDTRLSDVHTQPVLHNSVIVSPHTLSQSGASQ